MQAQHAPAIVAASIVGSKDRFTGIRGTFSPLEKPSSLKKAILWRLSPVSAGPMTAL